MLSALLMLAISVEGDAQRAEPVLTAKPTDTPTPTATQTATPTPTSAPTVTPTATPTIDPMIDTAAEWAVDAILPWRGEIERINKNENLGLDTALVMAVIAAESGGDWTLVSRAGACGLMQVIPQPWYELNAGSICGSNVGNIYMGMYILKWSLDLADRKGLDLKYGLAFYNCSYDAVMDDRCGSHGGLHYAEEILEFWYPRFDRRLR